LATTWRSGLARSERAIVSYGAAAAKKIVRNENLSGQAEELLSVSDREKAAEGAARGVHSFEVEDGRGEVLIVGVGDPPVNLSIGLRRTPENASEATPSTVGSGKSAATDGRSASTRSTLAGEKGIGVLISDGWHSRRTRPRRLTQLDLHV
jgi:hypothetical protein